MYFLKLGLHLVPVVCNFVQDRKETAQKEKQYTKNIKQHKTIQKHRILKTKIQNKNTNINRKIS
jgi:hypothetical protein